MGFQRNVTGTYYKVEVSFKKKKKMKRYSRNGIGFYLKSLIAQFHPWNLEFVPFSHLSNCVFFFTRLSMSESVSGMIFLSISH